MYYNKFVIQNFKGIRDLTLDLDKQSNNVFTLVGLNESGKSTILEAMSLLNAIDTPDNVHDFIPKSLRSNFTGNITIWGYLTIEEGDIEVLTSLLKKQGYKNVTIPTQLVIFKRFDYVDSENKPEDFIKRIYQFSIKGQKGKSKKIGEIDYKSDLETHGMIRQVLSEKLIPAILYYPNFLFDFPEKIYLKKQPNEKDEQPLYREVIGDILNSIDTQLTIDKHLLERALSGKLDSKRALDSTLLKMNAKVTKTVFGAWDTLFDSKGKEIIITINADQNNEYFLEFNLKEHYNYFQISERSLGFRWFFTFLLFTEFRKNRASKSGEILFMLDEPASNLHSTAQKNLLTTFEAILDKAKLIYTTHSHHLINPKWLSGAYIVRNKSINYESEFDYDAESADIEVIQYKQFVASHPNQKSFFQPILDTLDYQPGLLEEVPGIIITEGKNDFYILKYLIFLLNEDKYNNLRIYPGGGANRNTNTIALYLGWGKPFLIFLDSDKGGVSAKTTYLKEFGMFIDENVKTFLDVCNTFQDFAIEDLFTEDDKISITKLFDGKLTAFKKSAFNTAIENLYITNEKINLSKQTQENFKKVLKFLLEYTKKHFK
jgi:predicted ATPase